MNDLEQAAQLVYPYRCLPLWRFVADGRPVKHIDREGQLQPNEWPLAIAAHMRSELSLAQVEQHARRVTIIGPTSRPSVLVSRF